MGISCAWFLSIFVLIRVQAVPPEACFANFRWDDCGKTPVPVMYYWKPGSRCEVGLWRGCLPNLNMFTDEYECVTTCIFTARAMPEDYHSMIDDESEKLHKVATDAVTENGNTTEVTGQTGTVATGGNTGGDAGGTTSGVTAIDVAKETGEGGNSTVAGDKATTAAGGEAAAATTAAPAA